MLEAPAAFSSTATKNPWATGTSQWFTQPWLSALLGVRKLPLRLLADQWLAATASQEPGTLLFLKRGPETEYSTAQVEPGEL